MRIGDMESLAERIARASPLHAEKLSDYPAEISSVPVPFYEQHRVVSIRVLLPHRPLVLWYADDGQMVIPLEGEEDIRQVNLREGLVLALTQVTQYVRFYLACGSHGRLRVIEHASDFPWLEASAESSDQRASRAQALQRMHPITASTSPTDSFWVSTTVLEGQNLVGLRLDVQPAGRVDLLERKVWVSELPVLADLD